MSGFGARAAKLLSASCKALSHLIDRASQMFRITAVTDAVRAPSRSWRDLRSPSRSN
jgi:hypothetical protein